MIREAVISDCGTYRYELRRVWDPSKLLLNWVLLNPSKADAQIDDATVRRCVGFARLWGFGGIIVTNLYAYRSTDPKNLWDVIDPIGPENEFYLKQAAQKSAVVVCAWGANATLERSEDVRRTLKRWLAFPRGVDEISNTSLYCLGTTKAGEPKHPLRLRSDTQLIRYAQ